MASAFRRASARICNVGLKSLCDNQRILLGRCISLLRHLPHLRRLVSSYVVYPVLPHWATVFRASSAALPLTNQKLLTTSCQLQAASYHGKIPIRIWAATDRPEFERLMLNRDTSRSAGGATERSPARKGWELWQQES